jgi:hypothetical protein
MDRRQQTAPHVLCQWSTVTDTVTPRSPDRAVGRLARPSTPAHVPRSSFLWDSLQCSLINKRPRVTGDHDVPYFPVVALEPANHWQVARCRTYPAASITHQQMESTQIII